MLVAKIEHDEGAEVRLFPARARTGSYLRRGKRARDLALFEAREKIERPCPTCGTWRNQNFFFWRGGRQRYLCPNCDPPHIIRWVMNNVTAGGS